MKPIDVILTSFCRYDLLDTTLTSFFKFNTYPLNRFYIAEDYGLDRMDATQLADLQKLQQKFPQIIWLLFPKRVGQVVALDTLTNLVKTDYYFTLEDDWQFLIPGFIEESYSILEKLTKCIIVHLRGLQRVNGGPARAYFEEGVWKLKKNFLNLWDGFGFCPSLRRLVDYQMIGYYGLHTTFLPNCCWYSEHKIGKLYSTLGYWAAVTEAAYTHHIGDNRGIRS